MFDLKAFGSRIKERRLAVNMTQDELAKKAGYSSRSSINKIEMGLVDIPQSKVMAIAQALDISPVYLMGLEELQNTKESDCNRLDAHETELLNVYRKNPDIQPTIDKILGISLDGYVNVYVAANSRDNRPDRIIRMSVEEAERLRNAPESNDILI